LIWQFLGHYNFILQENENDAEYLNGKHYILSVLEKADVIDGHELHYALKTTAMVLYWRYDIILTWYYYIGNDIVYYFIFIFFYLLWWGYKLREVK
jgi:hypothetical protein